VARTLTDLAGEDKISCNHVLEAIIRQQMEKGV
jgi:predicted ATPase with chaperone activity